MVHMMDCFCSLQVFLLTCEKPLNPVEVEVLFSPFKGPHADRVTCRATTNHQVRTPEELKIVNLLFYSESFKHMRRCTRCPLITQPPLTVK